MPKSITIEEIEKRIFLIHGDIVTIDESTYSKMGVRTRFIDKDYGEWLAYPGHVIKGHGHPVRGLIKQRVNFKEKYGVNSAAQCPQFIEKMIETSGHVYRIKNWKTQKTELCKGTWEASVVVHFNQEKVVFLAQSTIFNVPEDVVKTEAGYPSTYRPDFYLPGRDLWIEVKGDFKKRKDGVLASKLKWEWFHKTYPNSELWDKKRLKELGITMLSSKKLELFCLPLTSNPLPLNLSS